MNCNSEYINKLLCVSSFLAIIQQRFLASGKYQAIPGILPTQQGKHELF